MKILIILILGTACNKKDKPSVSKQGGGTFTGEEFADKTEADTTFYPEDPYEPKKMPEQARPNMVYIEGGRCVLGFHKDEFTHQRTHKITATVPSFFMDQTEIANIHWLEYLHYLKQKSPEKYRQALPDTNVWKRHFSFNDYFVEKYLRHPAFRFYPVVGVSWLQATDYCKWRTKMVQEGPEWKNDKEQEDSSPPEQTDSLSVSENDSTKKGKEPEWDFGFEEFDEKNKSKKKDSTQVDSAKAEEDKKEEPKKAEFRLPTEAEWVYAAQGYIGKPYLQEKGLYKRVYPWDGKSMRNPWTDEVGYFFANFKRGRGDYGGVSSQPNDGAVYTEYIYSYPPNDFGLYNMAGNVNEWVKNMYKKIPFGRKFELNSEKRNLKNKKSESNKIRNKYNKYLKENRYRVYKGGSWNDNAYWLSPSTRRMLLEDSSTSTIGLRCAMSAFPGDKN